MKPDEIKSQEDLKKYLAETEANHAIVKAEEDKKAAEKEAELKLMKDELKANREKLAEVTSKNWVEKFSTKDTPEDRLYRFGMFIKGIATRDRELINKYGSGKGGGFLSNVSQKAWSENEYNAQARVEGQITAPDGVTKVSSVGTPLVSDSTTGSYLIPVEYMNEVAYVAKQASQMMGQVTEVPMISRQKLFPIQNAAATMSWNTGQTSAKSEVNPTFTQGTLTAQTAAIWTSITDELQEDSIVPLAAYFRDIFGQAWGYEFDYQCTQSNANPFTGMLNGATNSYVMGAGQTTFDSFTFQDGISTIQKLTTEMKRVGAKFIMHATVFDNLRKLVDANGNPIFFNPTFAGVGADGGAQGMGPRGTLFGYPYLTTDGMIPNSSSTVSTKFMIFGNPKYFYYGNRVGMEFKVFDQTVNALQYDQIYFRMRLRAAFTTAVTGAFVAVSTSAS